MREPPWLESPDLGDMHIGRVVAYVLLACALFACGWVLGSL